MFGFIKKEVVGLDIDENSIEAVQLTKNAGVVVIKNISRSELPDGIINNGRVKDEKRLIEAINKLYQKAKPRPIKNRSAIFGLSESQIFTHVFTFQSDKRIYSSDRQEVVAEEVKKIIPLDQDDTIYSFKVLSREKNKEEILIIAASKKMVLSWNDFFKAAKLKVKLFDIETLASFRGLMSKPPKDPICVIDIGAASSSIAIFDKFGLRYSASINKAGNYLTKQIAIELKIEINEAEKQKQSANITKGDKLANIIIKSFEPILKDIASFIKYWQDKSQAEVKEVYLIGGTARLGGLEKYLSDNLAWPVAVGRPALRSKKASLLYLEAIGLALRGVEKKWAQRDPFISIRRRIIKSKGKSAKGEKVISNRSVEDIMSGNIEKKRSISQVVILALIIIFGLVAIVGAYFYRNYDRSMRQQDKEQGTALYSQMQTIELTVPVAIKSTEYASDRIRGRLLETTKAVAGDYESTFVLSKEEVDSRLKADEKLWPEPVVSSYFDGGELISPVVSSWLIYDGSDADKLFLSAFDKLNKNKVDFSLSNIKSTILEPTDNDGVYLLTAEVTVYLDKPIEAVE